MADDAAPRPVRFTSAEFLRMAEAGVFPARRVELRGGEIVERSPTHRFHARLRRAFAARIEAALAAAGDERHVLEEASEAFDGFVPTPVIVVLAERPGADGPIAPEEATLIVEIADTTLEDDLGDKNDRYEAAGLAEYWVVDAKGRQVLRFARQNAVFVPAPPAPFGAPVETMTEPRFTIAAHELPER